MSSFASNSDSTHHWELTTQSVSNVPSVATIRWLIAVSVAVVCTVLASLIAGGTDSPGLIVAATSLIGVTLAVYAWGVFSISGGVVVSTIIALCLIWVWAARPAQGEAAVIVAFAVLSVVAVIQRKRRYSRLLHMTQLLEDLSEERTVKKQAVEFTQKTRENLQGKLARYQRLQSIAEQLSNLMDLAAIGKLAVKSTFELIGKSQVCLLFLVDKEKQSLSLFASQKSSSVTSVPAKHGDQFDQHVLRTHRPLLVNDVRKDFRFTMTGVSSRTIGSVIACPLLLNQSAEGVLRLDSLSAGAYTQDDLRFLDILMDLVATSIANGRLFAKTQYLAMTDGLTGLLLRRSMLEQMARELTRAARSCEPLSVLMLDLDHFKAYNDTYGHTAGDAVLVQVAASLRKAVPADGLCARYGGEEFAVVLPRASRSEAKGVAEAIRAGVETALKKATRREKPMTISIGVASFPEDAKSELELIRAADQMLYEAKRSGRNRVAF